MTTVYLAFFAFAAIGLVIQYFFLQEMRSRHPTVWESLGCPTLIVNNNRATCWAVLRYLWRKEYATLNDLQFARFAAFVRGYIIAYFVVFALVFVLSFVLALMYPRDTPNI